MDLIAPGLPISHDSITWLESHISSVLLKSRLSINHNSSNCLFTCLLALAWDQSLVELERTANTRPSNDEVPYGNWTQHSGLPNYNCWFQNRERSSNHHHNINQSLFTANLWEICGVIIIWALLITRFLHCGTCCFLFHEASKSSALLSRTSMRAVEQSYKIVVPLLKWIFIVNLVLALWSPGSECKYHHRQERTLLTCTQVLKCWTFLVFMSCFQASIIWI